MATKMDKSPAFLLYTDKFFTGSADMQPETVGIYIRLLCKLWNLPDGLPTDLKKLARLALVSEKVFTKCWHSDLLSEKFILNDKNNITNERLEIVRGERLEKSTKARESALIKWELERQKSDANAVQTHSERNANGMHISKDKLSKENINKDNNDVGVKTPPPTQKVKVKKHFVKPKWEEVANCMFITLKAKNITWPKEKLQAEAERMVNFYESKGWMVGKNPMKDWQAATRTWLSNVDTFTGPTPGYITASTPINQQAPRPKAKTNDELIAETAKALGS